MSGFVSVFFMAALLGAASFGTGMLPLSVAFSKTSLSSLSALGTGLLIGAALGVVIPEGIETLALSRQTEPFPTSTIALALITGFTFMLVVERQVSSHTHPYATDGPPPELSEDSAVEFDVELGDLERTEGIGSGQPPRIPSRSHAEDASESRGRAYPLTLGLVVHALADGLALGSAALSDAGQEPATSGSIEFSGLSIVVFLALVVHKALNYTAPTALALTTSLLSTSLPPSQCKQHLAIFSAATPISTVVSYALLSFFRADSQGRWPGVALLFSGGTFLYVATVLQGSLTHGRSATGEDGGSKGRQLLLTIAGMLAPYCVAAILGDDHGD
ncbi:Zinc/iron permease [Lenzites betulinus]|nr:Zinc/iron permease [Lenzites betulinus]